MIIFLHGPDTWRSQQKLSEIQTKFKKDIDPSGSNITILNGGKINLADFNQAVTARPFLARRRLIIVKDLAAEGKDTAKEVAKILDDIDNDEIMLVFLETQKLRADNVLLKRLKKEKFAQEFGWLEGRALENWIIAQSKNNQATINSAAVNLLIERVGSDLWQMNNELAKLAALADGETITPELVKQLVAGQHDDNVFNFVDALANKNPQLAHKLLADQLQSGAHELYLLTMITRQFRILIQLREALDAGQTNQRALASEFKIHPFVVQKGLSQAKRFTASQLIKIYRSLLQTDIKIKSSQGDSRALFDRLIAEITNQ